jgi:ATP-dependent exoDNAse (exonuclease V) alpha subunit
VLERWLETGVLVIDEISMVDGAFVSDLSLSLALEKREGAWS